MGIEYFSINLGVIYTFYIILQSELEDNISLIFKYTFILQSNSQTISDKNIYVPVFKTTPTSRTKCVHCQVVCSLILHFKDQLDKIFMKSQRKDLSSRRSSRDQSKKVAHPTSTTTNHKKINYPIAVSMGTTTATRSVMLHSHRGTVAKVEPSIFPTNSQHSRKLSIQQPSRKESIVMVSSKEKIKKEHARSNSTISKKSLKDSKNCLKIDLSKLTAKHQKQNKILIQQRKKQELANTEFCRNHFEFQYVIGKGGFGKVWSVLMKRNGQPYAMKEMNKSKIIAKKSIHSVLNERELLSQLKHPFLVNMSYSFQDREKLYLVMDLLVGGDLRYHMGVRRRFREPQAKFFIACILIGLEFLHLHNIIHRDIKPENLVFDDMGYLRITDLGIARIMKPNNNGDTSGTPGYMAPEVMCRQDHSFPVDYYAVGIIAYELMLGRRPYNGRNRKEIRDQILSKQVQIRPEEIPSGWSPEAANFINRMIQRKTQNRLGTEGGMTEIKDHPWFKGFPWGPLLKKNVSSPFVPKNILGSEDYLDQISESSEDENEQENMLLLRKDEVEDLFSGYAYYSRQQMEKKTVTTKYSATTANTHTSYIDEKETHRPKPKTNNFFKL